MTDKIEKLKKLLEIANDGLDRKSFELAFKTLIDFIKRTDKVLTDKIDGKLLTAEEKLDELNKIYKETISRIEDDNQATLSNVKKWVFGKVAELFIKSKVNDKVNEIDAKLREIGSKEWPDTDLLAKQASDLAITAIKPLIPKEVAFDEEISKAGDLIASTLEAQPEDKKLEIEAIKDLRKELDELRAMKGRVLGGGGGFSRMAMEQYFIDDDTPAEVPNGVITDFTPTYSFMASSLKVFNDGQRMKIGATKDYTIVSGKVVYNTAPLADVIITFDYRRA